MIIRRGQAATAERSTWRMVDNAGVVLKSGRVDGSDA